MNSPHLLPGEILIRAESPTHYCQWIGDANSPHLNERAASCLKAVLNKSAPRTDGQENKTSPAPS